MNQTIEGIYKNGTVVLDRLPAGVTEARVVVKFVEQPQVEDATPTLKFGMFARADRPLTSDEDLEATKKSWNRDVE